MSLPEATARPCKECPWRRSSVPGWLGPFDANEWVQAAHGDVAIACHLTIHGGDGWDSPGVLQCRGAATYRANVCKSPRDPDVVVGPVDREGVFAVPQQFIDHHQGD